MKGHAPYRQVLTHGFTVDGQGRKMSKSIGNVVSPAGSDEQAGRRHTAAVGREHRLLRRDDGVRRDPQALSADAYRRIRNTARFLLANLNGFNPATDMVAPADMVVMDRWAVGRARASSRDHQGL
jgi:isoleucyl-tRNA synthetase